jgi:hypothetical protein
MEENPEENWEFDFSDEMNNIPNETMAEFISTFISAAAQAEGLYRKHFCEVIANKLYDEFGGSGMVEMMVALDKRTKWISDILFDSADLDNIAFTKYGIYDPELIEKARNTQAVQDMGEKIWRLRRKYAKLIVDEVMAEKSPE